MLKPTRDQMVNKLINVYQSFSGGTSIVKEPAVKKSANLDISIENLESKSLIYWTPKDYIRYFAFKYKEKFDCQFQISYSADIKMITILGRYFKSLGYDFRFHTKGIIDWAFENSDFLIKKSEYITIHTITKFVNEYVQSKVLDINEHTEPTESFDFIAHLDDLYSNKKVLSALRQFGIPITCSYLAHHKNHKQSQIAKDLKSLSVSEDDIYKIAKSSIIRSPYNSGMIFLDWRKQFKDKFKFCTNEPWWREVDYNGTPNKDYDSLLK